MGRYLGAYVFQVESPKNLVLVGTHLPNTHYFFPTFSPRYLSGYRPTIWFISGRWSESTSIFLSIEIPVSLIWRGTFREICNFWGAWTNHGTNQSSQSAKYADKPRHFLRILSHLPILTGFYASCHRPGGVYSPQLSNWIRGRFLSPQLTRTRS